MRIRDFSTIRMGHTFRRGLRGVADGSVAVIQPKNITDNGALCVEDEELVRVDVAESKAASPGDVLVVNRGRFAAAVFHLEQGGPYIVPSSILVLTVTQPSVLPEYVALYLNSAPGQRLFWRRQETTTVPFISTHNLAQMDIPIPPIARQRALVRLEAGNRDYARLTARKLELRRQILNHEMAKLR